MAVETMRYAVSMGEMINSPIRIVLHRGRKYNNLIVLGEHLEKLIGPRSNIQLALILILLHVVEQGLIQIEDEGVLHGEAGGADVGGFDLLQGVGGVYLYS